MVTELEKKIEAIKNEIAFHNSIKNYNMIPILENELRKLEDQYNEVNKEDNTEEDYLEGIEDDNIDNEFELEDNMEEDYLEGIEDDNIDNEFELEDNMEEDNMEEDNMEEDYLEGIEDDNIDNEFELEDNNNEKIENNNVKLIDTSAKKLIKWSSTNIKNISNYEEELHLLTNEELCFILKSSKTNILSNKLVDEEDINFLEHIETTLNIEELILKMHKYYLICISLGLIQKKVLLEKQAFLNFIYIKEEIQKLQDFKKFLLDFSEKQEELSSLLEIDEFFSNIKKILGIRNDR